MFAIKGTRHRALWPLAACGVAVVLWAGLSQPGPGSRPQTADNADAGGGSLLEPRYEAVRLRPVMPSPPPAPTAAANVGQLALPEGRTALLRRGLSGGPAEREAAVLRLREWAAQDGAAAAAWAASRAPGAERDELLVAVATVWAEADLSAAIAWAANLADTAARPAVLQAIGYEAAREDPVAAFSLALDLPEGDSRDALLLHAAAQCALDDPARMTALAEEFSEPVFRRRLQALVATTWADREPAAAAEWVVGHMPASRERDDALAGIALRWRQSDPPAAAAWEESRLR